MKKNIVANYLGQAWQSLMSIAFIPLYIHYLGIEAYGLIGIFALLQTFLRLLDAGMKPALTREMSRYLGGAHTAETIRDLLRSIEVIALLIAMAIAVGIWAGSRWLATDWVVAEKLPIEAVARAFSIMGAVTALRFVQDVYVASMAGLQRQVLLNVIMSIMATLRGAGSVGVLLWISPTIDAFFIWQGLISVISVAWFAGAVYKILPCGSRPARFSSTSLANIWHFALGMVAITVFTTLVTQIDKVLLTRFLTLEAFSYYALAALAANSLYLLVMPISGAIYPRLTELVVRGDGAALSATYHQGTQLITVVVGAAAIMLMFFADQILALWTQDPVLTQRVAPIATVLAFGTLLNGFMIMPWYLQLAHGRTSMILTINIILICVLVPGLIWAVPIYGVLGAAVTWTVVNAGYFLIGGQFMHRGSLLSEKWKWYGRDIFLPLGAAAAVATSVRLLAPSGLGTIGTFVVLVLTSGCLLLAAAVAAPAVRTRVVVELAGRLRPKVAPTA